MKGLFIPEITAEMFRSGCLESIEALMAEGEMYEIDHEPERKKGMWIEKYHAYSDEETVIKDWQSCRCSECGRYDTRPYMYFFSEPNYCSFCGAAMRGEQNE